MLGEGATDLGWRNRRRPTPIAPCTSEAVDRISDIAGCFDIRRRRSAHREVLVTAAIAATGNNERCREPIRPACRRRTSLMLNQVRSNPGVGRRRLDRIEFYEQAQTVADFVRVTQFDNLKYVGVFRPDTLQVRLVCKQKCDSALATSPGTAE
jgi:hypothetical protein